MFQDLDESLLLLAAFITAMFALPFVMAWLEQTAKPSPVRSPRPPRRAFDDRDGSR